MAQQSSLLPRRGDVHITASMEKFQDAFLGAIAAAAGCRLSKPEPDPGLDWTIHHRSDRHPVVNNAQIDVALKATYQQAPAAAGDFPFALENPHLAVLSEARIVQPRLLLVLLIPRKVDDWIATGNYFMAVHSRMYWVNLRDQPPTGQDSTTVRVPYSHEFDAHTLCDMMEKIGQGDLL